MFRQLSAALEVQNHYSRLVHSASLVFLSIILAFTLSVTDTRQESDPRVNVTKLNVLEAVEK